MKSFLLVLPCVLMLAVAPGCGKKEGDASGSGDTRRGGDPASGYLRATLEAGETAAGTIGLTALRSAIRVYQVQEGSNPPSLDDLVSKGYLPQLPREPVGKRYAYDAKSGTVNLAAQ